MAEAEVLVTFEVSILVTSEGENAKQIIRSAENMAQAWDLDDLSRIEHWRLRGYGVNREKSEIHNNIREEN